MPLGEILFGRIVGRAFQWLGGSIRYIYGTTIRRLGITKRNAYTFQEYIHGPNDPDDVVFDTIGHRFNNRLLGLIVIGVILIGSTQGC